MPLIIPLRRMRHGNAFRATSLRLPADLNMPFIGVDHAWMSGPVFPAHHHAGLSAVSYVFPDSETGISNRDNIGSRNLIHPGGIHWAAAGKGIVHEEIPAELGKTVHSLQIFVGLSDPDMAPGAFRLNAPDVPVVSTDGAKIRVPVGHFANVSSPLLPPTNVTVLDISLEEGGHIALPVPAGHSAFVMPVVGELLIGDQSFSHNDLRVPVFPAQDSLRSISLKAQHGYGKAVFFSGPTLNQH